MASIELQVKAKLTGKRLKRPTAKVRKSAMSDTGIIIEVTGPDGTRVLIDIDTHRDHSGLSIRPRGVFDGSKQSGEDVSIQTRNLHSRDCALARYYERGDACILAARCDCGTDLVPVRYDWEPTAKGPDADEGKRIVSNPAQVSP